MARLVDAFVEFLTALSGPPGLSENERGELYLLARHFGITAFEARHVRPAWEMDMLIEGFTTDQGEQ